MALRVVNAACGGWLASRRGCHSASGNLFCPSGDRCFFSGGRARHPTPARRDMPVNSPLDTKLARAKFRRPRIGYAV
jgi:hypothetical protein